MKNFLGLNINTKKILDLSNRLTLLNRDIMMYEYEMEYDKILNLILRDYLGDEEYQRIPTKF